MRIARVFIVRLARSPKRWSDSLLSLPAGMCLITCARAHDFARDAFALARDDDGSPLIDERAPFHRVVSR